MGACPVKPTEVLEVLQKQHDAIDRLMAERGAIDKTFYPSGSGSIWDAAILGHNAICRLRAEVRGEPTFECPACHSVSYHPKDIENGYCGRCHDFTGKPASAP